MDGVLRDISSLSALFTSNSWKFNPLYKKGCKTLLQRATCLCAKRSWMCEDGGVLWKSGLCNGFLIVLVRVLSLLQDCKYSCVPTFEYSSRDFWSLWLELFWYERLVESSNSQSYPIHDLDTMCLREDMYPVLQTGSPNDIDGRATMDSCEIKGDNSFSFKKYIRKPDHGTVGAIREVVFKDFEGRTFASKSMDSECLFEIDIHVKVNHPNVVRVKGWCQTSGIVPFLVMELMDKDLREWVQEQHPLNDNEASRFHKGSWFHLDYMVVAIDILYQVAKAMQHVHLCNIAHRDLKTDNILVREELYEGRPVSYFVTAKLADFGASKQKEDGLFTTARIGTRPYRAPEVIVAEDSNRKYSPKADVWSFGVLAWEVLTGKFPSEKDGKAQKWPEQRGWIHPYLMGCIQRCWEPKPAKRPTFESICILMQNLKRTMFRNKGIYHASLFILCGKSPIKLATEYQKNQNDLDKWWMSVLINDLRPPKSPFNFNPQGCDPHKVKKILNSLCKSRLPTTFIMCGCFSPELSQVGVCSPRVLGSSFNSILSNGNGSSTISMDAYDWTDDHPVGQELCSVAALSNAVFMACSVVGDNLDGVGKELRNSIKLFFQTLANRLHQQCYGCQSCPCSHHAM